MRSRYTYLRDRQVRELEAQSLICDPNYDFRINIYHVLNYARLNSEELLNTFIMHGNTLRLNSIEGKKRNGKWRIYGTVSDDRGMSVPCHWKYIIKSGHGDIIDMMKPIVKRIQRKAGHTIESRQKQGEPL